MLVVVVVVLLTLLFCSLDGMEMEGGGCFVCLLLGGFVVGGFVFCFVVLFIAITQIYLHALFNCFHIRRECTKIPTRCLAW